MIKLNLKNLLIGNEQDVKHYTEAKLLKVKDMLINKTGKGSDFLGWLDWPNKNFTDNEFKKMQELNNTWKKLGVDTVVVIGIGGSYIGTKAGVEMCLSAFDKHPVELVFASGLHSSYTNSLLKRLKTRNWAIIVISKSGTTFETAVNFRIYRDALNSQYKAQHSQRIVAVTDAQKGVLKTLADKNHYQTLTIPNDIGGRYSTLTPVGLFAMLVAGIDVNEILKGWTTMLTEFKKQPVLENQAMLYAATRYYLLKKHKKDVEIFATYENNMRFVSEHYKQIFAESEGKVLECVLPTVANNSEDLHSIGQLYQQGIDHCFETSLIYDTINDNVVIPASAFGNDDNLDYITGKKLIELNVKIKEAVIKAHTDLAKIPNLVIELPAPSAYTFGYLAAWMAVAAATSAYLLEVNPFDQPGVEAYKAEMKKLIK